jgi:hypothetical protein
MQYFVLLPRSRGSGISQANCTALLHPHSQYANENLSVEDLVELALQTISALKGLINTREACCERQQNGIELVGQVEVP